MLVLLVVVLLLLRLRLRLRLVLVLVLPHHRLVDECHVERARAPCWTDGL